MSARARHQPWFRPAPGPRPKLDDFLRERHIEGAEPTVWVSYDAPGLGEVEAYEYTSAVSPERWAQIEAELESFYRNVPDPVAIFGTPVEPK